MPSVDGFLTLFFVFIAKVGYTREYKEKLRIFFDIPLVCTTFVGMMENLIGETHRPGRIEVVCGSMFSGKTEELIRRMKRAKFAKQKVEIFKPSIDTRYSEEDVISHDRNVIPSTPIDSSAAILLLSSETEVVGIDEAQFFDDGIVDVCNQLANRGVRVIVAGLDMDFLGKPFGPMPALCAIADEVTKVHAICVRCGALAYISHRLVANTKTVMLGEQTEYEPLCRECYKKEMANAYSAPTIDR